MSPYEQLLAEWRARPRAHGRTLEEQEALYKARGFVFATPEFYAMGRAVPKGQPDAQVLDPNVCWPRFQCDTWYIAEMCGSMGAMWPIMPWPLPWIAWCSAKDPLQEVRYYQTETLRRMTTGA